MTPIYENEVYTNDEAASILKVSRSTLMRLIKKNIIYAAKIGGQYRILGSELLKLLLPDDEFQKARKMYHSGKEVIKDMEKSLGDPS